MYDGCFGLNRRPFVAVPQVDYYFPAGAIEGARTTLARCIQRGEGRRLGHWPLGHGQDAVVSRAGRAIPAIVSGGDVGQRPAEHPARLFQAILYELGRPYRGMDEGELRLATVDYLTTGVGDGRGMVLLVDEAHTLPLRLLEEIRLLTNLAQDGQPLVRLVLAGGPALEERLASPKLDSFSQRLSARCYLEAFNRTETQNYIQSQIDSAGGRGEQVFPATACQSVFQATGGVPRLINQVCDHALLLAYVAGRKWVEPAGVEEAWADLQQLPMPSGGESKPTAATSGVIEFGAWTTRPRRTKLPKRPKIHRTIPSSRRRSFASRMLRNLRKLRKLKKRSRAKIPNRPNRFTASNVCWPRLTMIFSPPERSDPRSSCASRSLPIRSRRSSSTKRWCRTAMRRGRRRRRHPPLAANRRCHLPLSVSRRRRRRRRLLPRRP